MCTKNRFNLSKSTDNQSVEENELRTSIKNCELSIRISKDLINTYQKQVADVTKRMVSLQQELDNLLNNKPLEPDYEPYLQQ
jgi:hypothetical protein